jgi:predicted transcriptional regulator
MRDHGFTDSVRDVFQKIVADLNFDTFVQVNVHRLAEQLGLWPKTVASALRQLERKGIVTRGQAGGVSVRFRLNDNYGWIGSQSAPPRKEERGPMDRGLAIVRG